jgi:sialic acid synthase SpsE
MEIIAEIGQNHNGDMGLARELIDAARDAGADVAKFQLFDAQALFSKEGNPWYDYNLSTELARDDLEPLAEYCASRNIEFMCSVFDIERIAWLEAIDTRRYKIASRSVGDDDLIAACAQTGKPLLVSLGMWDKPEFPNISAPGGVEYLHCISKYPTELADVNLGKIDFSVYAGFSDHTIGIAASVAAFARGARIVEKHFTLDKDMYGPDHAGSMTPDELAGLVAFRDAFRQLI